MLHYDANLRSYVINTINETIVALKICKNKKIISLYTKMKFSVKEFLIIDKIRIFLCIWLTLLKKSLIENFIFCVVGLFCY